MCSTCYNFEVKVLYQQHFTTLEVALSLCVLSDMSDVKTEDGYKKHLNCLHFDAAISLLLVSWSQ